MKYKYIIVEDLPNVAENLKFNLSKFENYQCKGLAININQAEELILKYNPELIFLDIELGIESGFELIPRLTKSLQTLPFIIVTSIVTQYAIDSYKIDAIDFINKPYTYQKLKTALEMFELKHFQNNDTLIISNSNGKNFIKLEDIYFIQAHGSYTFIYTIHNQELKFSKDLKEIQEMLPAFFIRIHKSYVVNKTKLKSIKNQTAHLLPLDIENPLDVIKIVLNTGIKISENYPISIF